MRAALDRPRKLPPTTRQLEILRLIADGYTDRQIGALLERSPETIKTHAVRLLTRMGASNRAHAVALGFRRGWLK